LLQDLVTAICVELVRHSQHPDGNKPRQYQPNADICNKAPRPLYYNAKTHMRRPKSLTNLLHYH
jgi:hypothetical protein